MGNEPTPETPETPETPGPRSLRNRAIFMYPEGDATLARYTKAQEPAPATSGGKKIQVTITATLEVDAEGWNMNYGTGTEVSEIRHDVKAYLHSLLNESNENLTVVRWA